MTNPKIRVDRPYGAGAESDGLSAVRAAIPILTYHSVRDKPWSNLNMFTVRPTQLADHLAFLKDQGYTSLRVSELAHAIRGGEPLPPRTVLITFDDGYADVHEQALAVLDKYRFTATLYMVTGLVRGEDLAQRNRPRYLSWAELRELDHAGIEIGSHSHTHPQLDVLAVDEARREVTRSKAILEEGLGHEVPSFAYPYGYHGPAVRRIVIQAGFLSACGVKQALSAYDDDPYALSRLLVTSRTDIQELGNWLEGRCLRVAPQGERLTTIGWRTVRRTRFVCGRAIASACRRLEVRPLRQFRVSRLKKLSYP